MPVSIEKYLYMRGGSVGIDAMINDDIAVTIETKDKRGKLIHPGTHKMSREVLFSYPVETFRKGIPVRVVPIADFDKDLPFP